MKEIYLFLCLIFVSYSYGQKATKNYIFNVELKNYLEAPVFENRNGELIYVGIDSSEKSFFSNYRITDFFQSYPSSQRERTLNMFTFITQSQLLMEDLLIKFPSKYLRIEDLTDIKVELHSYPNDYGSTSPVANLGINANLKSFDYVDVPKAWNYTTGNPNIKMGWSDAKIDITDLDFKFKTSFLAAYYNTSYHSLPFNVSNIETWHGTQTAAIGGAQGNNSHGVTGICMDCSIIATAYGYGAPGSQSNPTPNLNNLLQLALNGVKVINMSWGSANVNPNSYASSQWIMDEIHDMGVVLVASAGNANSFDYPNFLLYGFPASLNHVISVTSVNHKNKNVGDEVTHESYGDVSWFVEDLISPTGVMNQNGVYYTSYWEGHTINDKVDICAPGWATFRYDLFLGNGQLLYSGDGTSAAAPHVTGTIGLMFSLNNCLIPDEVEDILQLTSKNIESNPYNSYYLGKIGSGKLETGDAVEFVYEMMSSNGNALINDQDFYRFDFDLRHINNNLVIKDQIFRDKNTSNFVAKNSIEVLQSSDFKPNEYGFIDLKIDQSIDVNCSVVNNVAQSNTQQKKALVHSNVSKLYPNPNSGSFSIALENEKAKNVSIVIYNILGKPVYQAENLEDTFEVNLPNLAAGVYLVKLSAQNYTETLKFIKK